MTQQTKKAAILLLAKEMGLEKATPAEVEQIRRQMAARMGAEGAAGAEYIASVLRDAGVKVLWSTHADEAAQHEEEFEDLLHFATLNDAEMCIVRLDEMWRKFRSAGERAAAQRVLEVGRLGRRRAEMIARNAKVEARKRAQKEEIAQWFRVWLETPDAFFDWLEVRKATEEFQRKFGVAGE